MRRAPVLRKVSQESWNRFLKLRSTRTYTKGNILFYEDNLPLGMFFLCSGRVKIVQNDFENRHYIARVVEAPDLLGDRALIAGQPYQGTGEIMEEARVCFLKAEDFDAVFSSEPSVWCELARRFARNLGQAEEKSRDLALRSIRERLAKYLLRKLGANGADALLLPESRLELSEILGTSSEAICRTLAEFHAKSLIALQGRSVRILEKDRLRQIAKS